MKKKTKDIRILIVDDIFINRMLLGEILEFMQIDYAEAKNGKEAIEKLHKSSFDLVFMDIEMPVMNGIETTKNIKSTQTPFQHIPVIAITAHDPKTFANDFNDCNFDALLVKPYTEEKIREVIDHFFEKD